MCVLIHGWMCVCMQVVPVMCVRYKVTPRKLTDILHTFSECPIHIWSMHALCQCICRSLLTGIYLYSCYIGLQLIRTFQYHVLGPPLSLELAPFHCTVPDLEGAHAVCTVPPPCGVEGHLYHLTNALALTSIQHYHMRTGINGTSERGNRSIYTMHAHMTNHVFLL